MSVLHSKTISPPRAVWLEERGEAILQLSGNWGRDGPGVAVEGKPAAGLPSRYQTTQLGNYDSTLPAFLFALYRDHAPSKAANGQPPAFAGLPDNLRGLLELALAVPEEVGLQAPSKPASDIFKLGRFSLKIWENVRNLMEFTGRAAVSLGRFLTGRAHFRSKDFWMILQECGVQALPIVSLISFLIGLILAFVGNVQLANFGANLFVADLVGIAMVREMGAVMTGIIMSGRTGAAFAAHIGSMKANGEIDALRTFGFDPFDFLVLPRLLAMVLMMPLLTVYANVVGIFGGMLVGAFAGIPPALYYNETLTAVDMTNSSLGILKSLFFGAAIAISGCLQGMEAESSSSGVGEATTRSVVAAITTIIVLDSAFAAIFTIFDI